jgi:glutamate dehydrogenase/leucine dehydrogenase/CBS domain-containing protein
MIPKNMEAFLRAKLPERTWKNRLVNENGLCYMEFGPMDVDRLARLGIQVDRLGPKLVACIWDEETPLEVGGYLVIDNLAMGRPSMGGIRVLPNLAPYEVHNLARGMTLKNAAANLPYGGGKAAILAEPTVDHANHSEVIRRFARLLFRYRDIFLPGPDVGTNDADMKTIAIENGLDNALSKPVEMGGSNNAKLGAAGGGITIALRSLLEELPRLKSLSQFTNLSIPTPDKLTVMIQGFGHVGAHTARIIKEQLPDVQIVGISDSTGYLFDQAGLPIDVLFKLWEEGEHVCRPYYAANMNQSNSDIKYSNYPDDLLRESAFCFIPAAPVSNYIDTMAETNPCITIENVGRWSMILEGANTYSFDEDHRAARSRMERVVYRELGVMIAKDFLVNSGSVIFAAQEHLLKTPSHLRIPESIFGNRQAVDEWLQEHADELKELSEKRRQAAEIARESVIQKNMHELVNLLVSDPDMLPCDAAELISVQRITQRERARTARDIMESIITIPKNQTIQDAARLLVETECSLLAVINVRQELVGVVTSFDITQACAVGISLQTPLKEIMTKDVITASLEDSILELVRKLEYHEISTMPVVENNVVVGLISTDVLARRSLYPLLISRD